MHTDPDSTRALKRLLGADWQATLSSAMALESVALGGLGINDGVAVFSDGSVELRIQRDRGDLFLDLRRVGSSDWHPFWLVLHYLDRSISIDLLASARAEDVLRIGLSKNWSRISELLTSTAEFAAYLEFENRWASGESREAV